MKVLLLSREYPFLTSLATFILGALLVLAIHKVFADSTIIYACINNNSGSLRIVQQSTTCRNDETALSWNQQGPQGIPGPTGVPGPQGPAGTRSIGFGCPACNLQNSVVGVGSRFSGKDFSNFFMAGSQFPEGIDFSNASFANADLGRSFCRGNCNFSNVNFSGADLENTAMTGFGPTYSGNFSNANFTSANLKGGTFTGGDFTGAIWSNTTCPDGTNSDNNGNTCVGHF